jgi:hypothetical protein
MCWSILSIVFAFAAAVLWGRSAFVYVPVLGSAYGTIVSKMKDGSTENGSAPFSAALKKVAWLNAVAAACAFLSAAAQAVALFSGHTVG